MVVLSYSLEKDVEIKKKFNIKGKNTLIRMQIPRAIFIF